MLLGRKEVRGRAVEGDGVAGAPGDTGSLCREGGRAWVCRGQVRLKRCSQEAGYEGSFRRVQASARSAGG